MNRFVIAIAFAMGLMAVLWVGVGFVGSSALALVMTVAIAGVYLLGAFELRQFRAASASLAHALADVHQQLTDISVWLERVHPSLRTATRLRIEGERVALPGPALTPYLVGLLVMLGMLGTFLGMVVTFKGAVFALEGSSDLQAIRSALAAPIKGLALSFGTSVAGVATSAMLGLISAMCRRERADVARQLDACIATVFRPFSLVHQQQETFKALRGQAQALPELVSALQAMMSGLDRRSDQLSQHLLGQQQQFHRDVSVAYTDLSQAVGQSLQESLAASAKAAGDSLKPVVDAAMSTITQQSNLTHQRLIDATQAQINGLELALSAFTEVLEQRSHGALTRFSEAMTQAQADQRAADQQRLQAWTQALHEMAGALAGEWQRLGSQTIAQHQVICQSLENAAGHITEQASQHVSRTLTDLTQLVGQSEALIQSRVASEAQWLSAQGERMDQLSHVWRSELQTLRDEEALRGQAAVDRLTQLETAVAGHLAQLGNTLEAPLTRLLQTAAEVPQAASDVIAQLRQEMSRLTERDNLALAERTGMMEQMRTLLDSVNRAASQQQALIESLVTSAASALDKVGSELSASLGEQAGQVADVAAHVTSSAVELSSMGEAFSHGVALFSATNDKLVDSLRQIEGAIHQSMARSDEQLAYYVAQAREVIDLSISSQQGIVEDLRRLHGQQSALAGEGA